MRARAYAASVHQTRRAHALRPITAGADAARTGDKDAHRAEGSGRRARTGSVDRPCPRHPEHADQPVRPHDGEHTCSQPPLFGPAHPSTQAAAPRTLAGGHRPGCIVLMFQVAWHSRRYRIGRSPTKPNPPCASCRIARVAHAAPSPTSRSPRIIAEGCHPLSRSSLAVPQTNCNYLVA